MHFTILPFFRLFLSDIIYLCCGRKTRSLLLCDIERNIKWDEYAKKQRFTVIKLNYLLLNNLPFRNIFYYRVSMRRSCKILSSINKLLLKPLYTIEIGGKINGGLIISHNYSTIFPKIAGKNLRIGPGVTIGRNKIGYPMIGDNVYIGANSSIIGNIEITDNVIIGAGSVVVKNILESGVYIGNPLRFIRKIEERDYNEIT